jgi:AcrR family transcriptional regulator
VSGAFEDGVATSPQDGGTTLTRGRREDPRVTQTRELVYAATLEVVAEVGAAGVSVERIAERSGVARSTIYRRWPDQSKLYLEAFAQYARRAPAPMTGDTARDLEQYLSDTAARLNDPTYRSVLIALLDRVARDPNFANLHREIFDERDSRGAAVLRAGIEAGTIRKGTNVSEAVGTLRAPLFYLSVVRHEQIQPSDIREVLDYVLARYGAD